MLTQTIIVGLHVLTTLTLCQMTNAFVLQLTEKTSRDHRLCQPMAATFDPYEGSFKGRDGMERNKARMDLRNFLTQRSIQSFVYLLNQCREEHTVRWLEVRYRDSDSIVKLTNDNNDSLKSTCTLTQIILPALSTTEKTWFQKDW